MADWLAGDVHANGIKIHYYRSGGAKPPIVLCHGATDNGLCWTPITRVLEENYDVIMPDARWHGFSDGPAEGNSPDCQVEDLVGFVQALKLEKPVLMGHSMGANTVLKAASRYPELARAAILEDPPLREPQEIESSGQAQPFVERMRQSVLGYKAMSREGLIEMIHSQAPAWSEDELGPWADAKLQVSLNFMETRRNRPMPDSPWDDLAKITCPVLLITADPERGAIITPEVAQRASQVLPSIKVVRIHNAGHSIRREAFGFYMAAVKGFLSQV
jgi:pimeloyl-ACP methyl ester carboxylesterase